MARYHDWITCSSVLAVRGDGCGARSARCKVHYVVLSLISNRLNFIFYSNNNLYLRTPKYWIPMEKSSMEMVELIFAVKLRNLDVLEKTLLEVPFTS